MGGAVSASQAQQTPTVSATNATTEVGNETAVRINLSSAPNGVAGYNITISVNGTADATVGNASVPETFDLSSVETRTDKNVTLIAVDLDGSIASGQENISLATVQLTAQSSGNATVSVTVNQFDDPDGNRIEPRTRPGTIEVVANTSQSS